jgi:uncharacterized protein DUF3800
MYLAYIDDSGDPGVVAGSPTPTYTTACVLIRDQHWVPFSKTSSDFVVTYGRRSGFVCGRNMRLQAKAGTVKTFAVIIDKSKCATADDVRATAWRHTLERVEAFARHNNETVMLVPDSGEYDRFRKLARRMRRYSQVGAMTGGGTLSRPLARYLVDDPVERDSAQSYFVQLADLNAYAAYRKEQPDPLFPTTMWDELGLAILTEANENLVRRGVERPGILRGPR